MREGNRQQARGNSKNIALIPSALGALLFALCASAEAQQLKKVYQIGFLIGASAPSVAARVELKLICLRVRVHCRASDTFRTPKHEITQRSTYF